MSRSTEIAYALPLLAVVRGEGREVEDIPESSSLTGTTRMACRSSVAYARHVCSVQVKGQKTGTVKQPAIARIIKNLPKVSSSQPAVFTDVPRSW